MEKLDFQNVTSLSIGLELQDRKHKAILERATKWPHHASDVLDMADMLVAYCEVGACKRKTTAGKKESGSYHWRGEWKRVPYAGAMNRAYKLLGIRRGNRGMIRLGPGWKERLGEAGIDSETMEVAPGGEMKWARAWKQFCEYDSFRIDRQRQWNALGKKAEWPPPVLSWEARANSKVMRGKLKAKEKAEELEEGVEKGPRGYDITRGYRKRIMMEESS